MMLKWVKAYSNLQDHEKAECPHCKSNDISLMLILLNEETRVGFGIIWCNSCLHGYRMSRMLFGENTVGLIPSAEAQLPDNIQYDN